jgi:cell division septation protein DedD
MVNEGNAAAGRALVDSVVAASQPGTPAYAEAIYWRATLAPDSGVAENDYRRLIVEYPLYARTGEVLVRLAQLELLRGNIDAALMHLRRIQTEHPEFSNQALANYWISRALFEKADTTGACQAIREAARLVSPDDVELRNQIDFQNQQCIGVTSHVANSANTPVAPATTAAAPGRAAPAPPPARRANLFTIQIAAYPRSAQAKAAAARLAKRGFPARVDGTSAPFRLRVGRYESSADATTALHRLKQKGIAGMIVRAE